MEKQKILVIGAFTNGEEAMREFVLQRGGAAAYEIEFCGNNGNVIGRLRDVHGLAVVPVENSIIGPVPGISDALMEVRESGVQLIERARLDLPINHCLLGAQFLEGVDDVTKVISHPAAIAQCTRHLDQLGIAPENRYESESTGAAAEAVAHLRREDDERALAAIAPRVAAERLGLKVLSEHIEDVPGTFTTFLLLERE